MKQQENYWQVKATYGGKSKTPNVKIKGFSYQGVIVSEGKKPTDQQIKEFVLKKLGVQCQDPDIITTEKVEVKKLKMDFFFQYK